MEQFLKIFLNCLLLACSSFGQTKSQIMDAEVQKTVEDGINDINTQQNILSNETARKFQFGRAQFFDVLAQIMETGANSFDALSENFRPVRLPKQNATFDFIIVGAGPAGCVLANRLSENPNWTVYLLEAGGTENFLSDMPVLGAYLQGTNANWKYKSTPQKIACRGMYNNECSLPRGKLLGGSSGINFMIYNRGNKRDFDRWAEAGTKGWSYDDVLPYFKRSERANLKGLENSPYHNSSGPLSVEDISYRTETVHAYVKGAQEAGHKYTDYNGESEMGVSYVQATTLKGHRHSAAKAYIEPIKNRKNLHILNYATVTKVLIDPETLSAYGVKFVHRKKEYTIKARKEVILSAGAFNSPQLLMLSGVGPADVLNNIGIPVLKELPVGKTLYEHTSHFGSLFTVNATGSTLFADRVTPLDLIKFKTGDPSTRISTIAGIEALTFIKTPNSKEPRDYPDVELIFASTSLAGDYGTALKNGANVRQDLYDGYFKPLEKIEHFAVLVMQFHPKSIGRIWLETNDPFNPPTIDPNYFDDPDDVETILEGIKEVIRIAETPAMKKINTKLYETKTPGCENFDFGTDDYWRCSIKVLSYTVHHQVATCKMGPSSDPTTVVDNELKVHGMRRLRVVDTGIIPAPPTAHTNAASFMIGEKAADLIKNTWLEVK